MTYLAVFLFVVNGQFAHIYLGEFKNEATCVQHVQQQVPKVLPEVQNGLILCVKKLEV